MLSGSRFQEELTLTKKEALWDWVLTKGTNNGHELTWRRVSNGWGVNTEHGMIELPVKSKAFKWLEWIVFWLGGSLYEPLLCPAWA